MVTARKRDKGGGELVVLNKPQSVAAYPKNSYKTLK